MTKQYDKYDQGDIHWQWYHNTPNYFDLVNESLAPFKGIELGSVIDVGCGDGLPLSFLDQWGFKCYGVDSSKTGIDYALEHNVSAEYFIQKAEEFARRGMEFDYLYSLNTIEHLDDPNAMVEIMKKIKKFGVIVTDYAKGEGSKDRNDYHNIEFTPESFKELFKDFVLEQIPISNDAFFGFKISNK